MEKGVKVPVVLGKGLVLSTLLTVVAVFVMAVLLLKTGITEKTIRIVIIGVYVVACFLAGLYSGKKIKTRRFLWGMAAGLCYFLMLLIVALSIHGGHISSGLIATALICMGSGMLGGMVS